MQTISQYSNPRANLRKMFNYNMQLQRLLINPASHHPSSTLSQHTSSPMIPPPPPPPIHRRPSSRTAYRPKDKALAETPILLLKFNSINYYTISKDKTKGEGAHNSELLAAFGQKILAHVFVDISDQSINPRVIEPPLPDASVRSIGHTQDFTPALRKFRYSIERLPARHKRPVKPQEGG